MVDDSEKPRREALDPTELHDAVLEHLLNRIEGGNAQAAELAVAVRFLKDCGITAGRRNVKIKRLEESVKETQIPFPSSAETQSEIYA
ncbi:MAG TPA: hypothetical protein VJ997_06405 [Longimicrobiales bacterium]|nr:hypothetical protein [Longimicrobiales bacterium]